MLEKVSGCVVGRSASMLPQKVANEGDIVNSLLAPASQGLCHQQDERYTFSLASLIVNNQFFMFFHLQGDPFCVGCPELVVDCRVEITVTSREAGRPLHQFSKKISSGRLLEPEISDGASFWGARAAD